MAAKVLNQDLMVLELFLFENGIPRILRKLEAYMLLNN